MPIVAVSLIIALGVVVILLIKKGKLNKSFKLKTSTKQKITKPEKYTSFNYAYVTPFTFALKILKELLLMKKTILQQIKKMFKIRLQLKKYVFLKVNLTKLYTAIYSPKIMNLKINKFQTIIITTNKIFFFI